MGVATGGRIATKSVPVTIADPAEAVEYISSTRGPFSRDNPAWENEKRKAAADPACAAVLTVTLGYSRVGSTNQGVAGIGLLETAAPPFTGGKTILHALLSLQLYEANSMKQVTWANTHPGPSLFAGTVRGPHRELDQSWRIQKEAVLASQQHRKVVEELVRQAVGEVVPQVIAVDGKPGAAAAAAKSVRRPGE